MTEVVIFKRTLDDGSFKAAMDLDAITFLLTGLANKLTRLKQETAAKAVKEMADGFVVLGIEALENPKP